MKLTVGYGRREGGFALPTILLVATVMLVILTASISATAASRVALDSQFYNQLAEQAAQSGLARATECLKSNGYGVQWSTATVGRDLRPNSDCLGATMSGAFVSPYTIGTAGPSPSKVRTKYSVEAPDGTGIGSVLRVVGTTELVRTSAPHNVWRTYDQSLYLRIEPATRISCPEGFAAVPGDARYNTNDFCIGKYEAKNVGGKAVSQPGGTPWTSISQPDALSAARDACSGCDLITNAQWLTVAQNVLNVSSNWSGGAVGNGSIFNGHNDNSPAGVLSASADDNDGYFGTGNTSGGQRRTLRLNNGEVVWDLSGNLWEWTAETVNGGQPGQPGYAWRDWNTVENTGNLSPNPFPSFGTPAASSWTSSQQIGRLYSNSTENGLRGVQRGSFFNGGTTNAGIMALNFNDPPTTANGALGFRLVFNPLATTTCPSGQVLVPGNSSFGTKNFCVGKYEAKNAGGVAVSQAAGTPWVNISQDDAKVAASAACGTCRLISEAEWLTIGHNVLNVPTNWTGGGVGNGTVFRGHSDGSPASAQAGSDDANGYFGTGSSSGNQRRTLQLNTGESIWDFSGNVWEWTTGQINTTQPGDTAWAWREWSSVSIGPSGISPSPLPAYGTPAASAWDSTNGLGKLYSSGANYGLRAFLRSGNWSDSNGYGLFSLALNRATTTAHVDAGFRVTSDPISAISCSSGMVPVPGDSRFGTTDFCVGKYEAKNEGGVAVSKADGLPWGSISQTNAATAAAAACPKCHLISEAEWLTIAHNVMSVPSNWTGGSVGGGSLFRGHSDGSPGALQEASTDDSDGYINTGNTSGNQRRTLSLTNGSVIWDLSGNAYEWTSGQLTGAKPGESGNAYRNWNALADPGTMTPNPFPSFGTPAAGGWTTTQAVGGIYSNSDDLALRAFLRSGSYGTSSYTGVFFLNLLYTPTTSSATFSFRVAASP